MKRNVIGFRPSWMKDEPDVIVTEEVQEFVPEELIKLRFKIVQLMTFMSSSAFTKLRKQERADLIMEFAELNETELGYSRAVNNQY